jgi:molybdopterin synthase sulfur carrier subunit
MMVTVRLFGPQARMANRDSVAIEIPETEPTCARLREALAEAAPQLDSSLAASRFAVNYEYVVDERTQIQASDEVALIGMVSGG